MKFMLLIHGDEQAMMANTTDDAKGMSPEYAAYNQALIKAGALLEGERLQLTRTAASVRVRNGKTEVVDGPYAETREQFGGYYIIEAGDLAAAVDWATQCPGSLYGTVEVRPVSLS